MDALVEFRGVSKSFGGVAALCEVSLAIVRGQCHALVGENGAGKSTLGKILAGIHRPDAGVVVLDGRPRRFHSPADAARAGVGVVHQELAFCPDLSVAENLCLGRIPSRAGLVRWRAMRSEARRCLGQIGADLDVRRLMRTLSTGQEQLVQIAAAVGAGARVLVFDEPTSSLAEAETARLLGLIESLRARGVTIIYVSHRMPEVFRLADRISVLRDGRHVGTLAAAEASESAVTSLMIGRPLAPYVARHTARGAGQEVLRVERLSSRGRFRDVSLSVRSGEIVGLAGLVGAGRSEVAQAIFGLDRAATGRVFVDERPLRLASPRAALALGVALTPEDRKRQGLILGAAARRNFSLAILERLRRWLLLDQRRERRVTREYFDRLSIRARSLDAPAATLSGGNQQKVVLARWLARQPRLLIADEPTRGVDIGAKDTIHELLDDLACAGAAILLISSELPELIRLSTRVLVMRGGRLVDEICRADATQERLIAAMAGS